MSEPDDRRLREGFSGLAEEDRRGAPSFASVWSAAQIRAHRPARVTFARGLAAAAAAIIVLCATAVVLSKRDGLPSDPEAIVMARNISSWNAPTDEWLRSDISSIPNRVPSLSIDSIKLPAIPTQAQEVVR